MSLLPHRFFALNRASRLGTLTARKKPKSYPDGWAFISPVPGPSSGPWILHESGAGGECRLIDRADHPTMKAQVTTLNLLAAAWLSAVAVNAGDSRSAAGPAAYPEHVQWWGDARFGLFVHWGPVSLKGTEIGWSRGGDRRGYGSRGSQVPPDVYDNLYREFNPTGFDAREWVALARAAGMKHLVFTSRHHDGFSMFDTQASDYKITNPLSPFRCDVVRELAEACHAAGLRFGLYYSSSAGTETWSRSRTCRARCGRPEQEPLIRTT